MAKRTSTKSIKVFSFRVRSIEQGNGVLLDQLVRGHRYQHGWWDSDAQKFHDGLVQIELESRNRYRRLRVSDDEKVASLQAALEAIKEQIESLRNSQKDARSDAHSVRLNEKRSKKGRGVTVAPKRTVDGEVKVAIARLNLEKKQINEQLKAARKAFDERNAPADAELEKRIAERITNPKNMHEKGKVRDAVVAEMLGEKKWPRQWKAVQEIRKDINAKRRVAVLGKLHGVFAATYTLVNEAFMASLASCAKAGVDPSRRRFDGEGRVGAQICIGSTRVPVRELPTNQHSIKIASQRFGSKTRLSRQAADVQCVAKIGGGAPPILFTMRQHRTLPSDGEVTRAWFLARRTGLKTKWYFQMVVESEAYERKEPSGVGVVAFHLAWRLMQNGSLRVGYLLRDDGHHESLELPPEFMERLKFCESLRKVGDKYRDKARDVLIEVAKRMKNPSEEVAALCADVEAARKLYATKPKRSMNDEDRALIRKAYSHARIRRVVSELVRGSLRDRGRDLWKEWVAEEYRMSARGERDLLKEMDVVEEWLGRRGVKGLKALVMWLEMWRKKDLHLFEWETNYREHLFAWRGEIYKQIARRVAMEADMLLCDSTDLAALAKRPEAEEEEEQWRWARRQRQAACVYMLRRELKGTFGQRVRDVVPDAKVHAHCGGDIVQDGDAVVVKCGTCGHEVDRDFAVCERMLEDYDGGSARGSAVKKPRGPLADDVAC